MVAIQLSKQATPSPGPDRWDIELEVLGGIAELVEIPRNHPQGLGEAAREAAALIVSWGVPVDRRVIAALRRCRIIAVASIGVDTVDIAAATAAGIVVTNVPDIFIEEVADHTFALLLSASRRIRAVHTMAAEGNWYAGRALLGGVPRLHDRTLGLFGFGNVARCVARRAHGFGMQVIAHDPYVSELVMTGLGVEPVGHDELFRRAALLSLHAPLNGETAAAVNGRTLTLMPAGAVLVNTARGGLVDEAALIAALSAGHIGAAGLDVLAEEPPPPEHPLFGFDNVIITPHVAAATTRMRPESRRRAAREAALVLQGRWPLAAVNPAVLPRTPLERWQPYPMHRGPNV